MTEQFGGQQDAAPAFEKIQEFSAEVSIEGLPYIFSGKIQNTRGQEHVALMLHLPASEQDQNPIEIGYLTASSFRNRTMADMYVNMVKSYTDELREGSKYKNAHAGRFLIDNFLALCDSKGWRVAATASARGRLTDAQIYEWMERKGFPPADSRRPLVRAAQTPDPNQEIMKLLKSSR